MANSLKHSTVGTELTQTEWEAIDNHVFESQATGDLPYADSSTSLRRLGIGSTGDFLRVDDGKPDWQATTSITSLGTIATGVWQGTDVGVAYGGTGVSTLTANGVLIGNGSSAIGAVDMSTKGHMLLGDGSGNPQMLGVGTNNYVLTADSGETTGVKWAAPAAAAAGSLTGSTLASGVTASSLTSVGTLTALTTAGTVIVGNGYGEIIGHTAALNIGAGATTTLQVLGTAFADSGIAAGRFSADASGPSLRFAKSRHGSIVNTSGTIVADGDILGDIIFAGDDGADLRSIGAHIQAKVDGTPGSDDMPGRLIFLTTADGAASVTERMRISSAGKMFIANTGGLVVGHTAQVSPEGATPEFQIIGTAQGDTAVGMVRYSNDAGGNQFFMGKSRGASIGTNTAPANNDLIGGIYWCIADATDNDLGPQAAYFRAAVDGTPGNNDSPGRLEFATTADGSGGATERLRIANDGGIFAYNLLAASASTDVNINGSDELHSVTSSEYYKYDKRSLEIDSSLIYQLQPRSYRFGAKKSDAPADWPMADGEADDWGLTAEEVYDVLPELVNLKNGKPYSVKYSMLSVLLLNEIKKLREAA